MIIEVSKFEKQLIEHALIRLSLDKSDGFFYKEGNIKELWIKLHFCKEQLDTIPEHFTLEESYND